MAKVNWFYLNREERSRWITEKFSEIFSKSKKILDVGCGKDKFLKKFVPEGSSYLGIDVAGEPDMVVDFDKTGKLPFQDKEFDLVVCTDVLEHLEEIHSVYDELMRVSDKNIIITLPIPARPTVIKKFFLKERLKQYGLPVERPKDRHRWFFTYYEAEKFIRERASKKGFLIKIFESDADYTWQNVGFFKQTIAKLFGHHLVASLVIIHLEKK